MNIPTNRGIAYNYNGTPNKCPFCNRSISPVGIFGYTYNQTLEVYMYCPDEHCRKGFIAYYSVGNSTFGNYDNRTTKGTIVGKGFAQRIIEISTAFVTIYNQAYAAEQEQLFEICGVGYRKALEFLIKDYSILRNIDKKEQIEKTMLSNVIETYVNDSKIKSVAKRAAWLGNDETHYIRKWEGKDLSDLKKLIDLTVHWMEMEALTESFELEMPG